MLLEIHNLKKTLNRNSILNGINLKVSKAERVVIIGRSGGGKSVLLRHIMGLMQPDEGQVIYQGVDLTTLSEEELNPYRRKMAMLFQNGALFDSMSVEENLAFPLLEEGSLSEKEIQLKIEDALEMVDLPGQKKKMPAELSGGMKKRVALARAVITRPELMLYDEPTTGLDPIVADSINRLILRLAKKLDMACIVVTHDMVSAYLIADRICYLKDGTIYFEGTPQQVQNSEDPVVKKFVNGISESSDATI